MGDKIGLFILPILYVVNFFISHRCERAMLLLLHETSQGTFSHVFDRDSTDLDDVEKDIGDYSSKGKKKRDVDDHKII